METSTALALDKATQAETAIRNSLGSLLQIIEQHQLDADGEVSKALRALNDRLTSRAVRLAILGEFSSGKTSFINALLGINILQTGILPTTAVCTYITYGPSTQCEVLLKSGESIQLTPGEIGIFSAEGSRNSEVEEVRLQLPSPVLADGLMIVDTPGVNVNIDAHEAITGRAIDEANACVYLMDARQPGKKTTLDFLRRLSHKVGKFFLVLNRADILDSDEQKEALEFVKQALKDECGIADPKVVLLSSTLADEHGVWQTRFRELNSDLQSFMQNERKFVIATEVARLASVVNTRAEHLLRNKWSLAEQELALHHKLRLPESDELVQHLRTEITERIDKDAAELLSGFKEYHQQLTADLRNSIIQVIDSASSKDELTGSVQSAIGDDFGESTRRLQEYLVGHLRHTFEETSARVTSGVAYLLRGVSALEERAFFLRPFPYVLAGFGAFIGLGIALALRSGSGEIWSAPSLPLLIAAGFLAGLVLARILWTRRTRFSAPVNVNLDPKSFASQASSGFLFGYEKSRGKMVHGGRQLGMAGMRTGHPLVAGIGLAITAIGALFSPSLEKLKSQVMSNSLQACGNFSSATTAEGTAFINVGYQRVRQDLLHAIDSTVARYERILEKLVSSQRSITAGLERRRTELRAAVETSTRVQCELEAATALVRSCLLSYDVATPAAPTASSSSSGSEEPGGTASPKLDDYPSSFVSESNGVWLWWLAGIASLVMFFSALLVSPPSFLQITGFTNETHTNAVNAESSRTESQSMASPTTPAAVTIPAEPGQDGLTGYKLLGFRGGQFRSIADETAKTAGFRSLGCEAKGGDFVDCNYLREDDEKLRLGFQAKVLVIVDYECGMARYRQMRRELIDTYGPPREVPAPDGTKLSEMWGRVSDGPSLDIVERADKTAASFSLDYDQARFEKNKGVVREQVTGSSVTPSSATDYGSGPRSVPDAKRSKQLNAEGLSLLSHPQPNFENARAKFDAAVQADTNNMEALNNLGYVYGRIGDYRRAESTLLRVIEAAPNRKAAQGNLGYIQAKLGKTKEAADHFCQYVRLFDTLEKGKSTLARVTNDPDPNVQSAVNETVAACTR